MNKVHGFLLLIAAALFGVWWWRRNYVPSPLDRHYGDLTQRSLTGDLAQEMAWLAQPVSTMIGSGWGTTMRLNPANPMSPDNHPGKLMINTRFAQPGSF